MIVANLIYSTVFKRMMESERVAKLFIGTLLDQEIVSMELKHQEFTFIGDLEALCTVDATFENRERELMKVINDNEKALGENKK